MEAIASVIEWTIAVFVGVPAAIFGGLLAVSTGMLGVCVCVAAAVAPFYFGCIAIEKWRDKKRKHTHDAYTLERKSHE